MTLSLLDSRAVAGATNFSNRMQAAMSIAAALVYSETWILTATAQSNAGSKSIQMGVVPSWVVNGASIADVSLSSLVIPVNAIITNVATVGGTSTITISAALTGTIGNGDTISFPAHAKRAAFANQVVNGNWNQLAAALTVLSNPTLITEGLNDGSQTNGIPDTDLNFTVQSLWNTLAGA